MKKILLPLLSLLLLGCGATSEPDFTKVALNPTYYNNGQLYEIQLASELNERIDAEDNFLLYIYSPLCSVCTKFSPALTEFVEKSNLYVYKINENLLHYTPINDDVRYTPTTLIFEKGSIVYKGDTGSIYQNEKSFEAWVYARILKASEI